MPLNEIGNELGVSGVLIRKWKFLDKWDEIPVKRQRGGQPGNKNSVGNSGGPGGPVGNHKALKTGYYAKYLPEAVLEIVKEIEDSDPLEMLWNNIILLQAKLLHGQKIVHVNDKEDVTKVLTKFEEGKFGDKQEWEYQHAWDKFASASKADVMIMREFRSAIKQFLTIAPENDERRLKLEVMQAQIDRTRLDIDNAKKDNKKTDAEDWVSELKRVAERRKAAGKES